MELVTTSPENARRLGLDPMILSWVPEAAQKWHRDLSAGGFQLSLYKNNHLILTLWEGCDVFTGSPIRRDTLFPILSATKGIASMVLLHLHNRGYFEWTDRISRYWPKFGRHGKERATIEHLLSHRIGIPHVTATWRHWPDREHMTALVEESRADWEPGARYGYHGGSWGIIVDELVRRWTGGSQTGDVLREVLTSAMGIHNCFLGIPSHRYKDVARLAYLEPEQRLHSSPLGPICPESDYNSLKILTTCQSSGGAVTTAEDLARLYCLAAYRGRYQNDVLWSPTTQMRATQAQNDPEKEAPAVRPELAFEWGLGFMVSPSRTVYGSTPIGDQVVGHPGASGAVGYAEPEHHLSVAFTINGVGGRFMYMRYQQLGDLLRAALRLPA